MTEEKFEKAQEYLSGVRGTEMAIERLSNYVPNKCSFAIQIGGNTLYIETKLAEQIVKLATDYYEKKKSECQKQFDAL